MASLRPHWSPRNVSYSPGSQVSYGYQEANSRLAFGRLQKALEASGVSGRDVAFAHYYPLAEPLAAQVRKLRPEFFARSASWIGIYCLKASRHGRRLRRGCSRRGRTDS